MWEEKTHLRVLILDARFVDEMESMRDKKKNGSLEKIGFVGYGATKEISC